jgi:hypothetical protein
MRAQLLAFLLLSFFLVSADARPQVEGLPEVFGRRNDPAVVSKVAQSSASVEQVSADTVPAPRRVESAEPNFFDRLTGEPAVWYYRDKDGEIRLFDKNGFSPDTGEALLPITKEVVDRWKAQTSQRKPHPVERPNEYGFFDSITGNTKVWVHRSDSGTYEFFDGPGYYPGTGEPLTVATRDVVDSWQKSVQRTVQPFPHAIDPTKYSFFDQMTGEPHVWYWTSSVGDWQFYDNPGYEPQTGDKLHLIDKDAISRWQEDIRNSKIASPQKCYVITHGRVAVPMSIVPSRSYQSPDLCFGQVLARALLRHDCYIC